MDAKGFVVPPGGGSVLSMAPGRSAALKLLGGETGDSIMLFEETAPAGTETTFHLHRDSDEVAYVLSGEITFKIGDEVTVGGPGTCASALMRELVTHTAVISRNAIVTIKRSMNGIMLMSLLVARLPPP